MAQKDTGSGGLELSRRSFLKASAAAAAIGGGALDFVARPLAAEAAGVAHTYNTTCPYCSAACGQKVAVDADGNVLDVYGDFESPINSGGLCAKGAGSYQLVTNKRRLGVADNVDGMVGTAWKRAGNDPWTAIPAAQAMTEIAKGLVQARGSVTPGVTGASNAKTVQFFGCSHMNNEQNYVYRKLIADFGTSLVEHQARI